MVTLTTVYKAGTVSTHTMLDVHSAKSTGGRIFNANPVVMRIEVKEDENTLFVLAKNTDGKCIERVEVK